MFYITRAVLPTILNILRLARRQERREEDVKKQVASFIRGWAKKDLQKDQEALLYEQLRPLIAGSSPSNLLRAMRFKAPSDEEMQNIRTILEQHAPSDPVKSIVAGVTVTVSCLRRLFPQNTQADVMSDVVDGETGSARKSWVNDNVRTDLCLFYSTPNSNDVFTRLMLLFRSSTHTSYFSKSAARPWARSTNISLRASTP